MKTKDTLIRKPVEFTKTHKRVLHAIIHDKELNELNGFEYETGILLNYDPSHRLITLAPKVPGHLISQQEIRNIEVLITSYLAATKKDPKVLQLQIPGTEKPKTFLAPTKDAVARICSLAASDDNFKNEKFHLILDFKRNQDINEILSLIVDYPDLFNIYVRGSNTANHDHTHLTNVIKSIQANDIVRLGNLSLFKNRTALAEILAGSKSVCVKLESGTLLFFDHEKGELYPVTTPLVSEHMAIKHIISRKELYRQKTISELFSKNEQGSIQLKTGTALNYEPSKRLVTLQGDNTTDSEVQNIELLLSKFLKNTKDEGKILQLQIPGTSQPRTILAPTKEAVATICNLAAGGEKYDNKFHITLDFKNNQEVWDILPNLLENPKLFSIKIASAAILDFDDKDIKNKINLLEKLSKLVKTQQIKIEVKNFIIGNDIDLIDRLSGLVFKPHQIKIEIDNFTLAEKKRKHSIKHHKLLKDIFKTDNVLVNFFENVTIKDNKGIDRPINEYKRVAISERGLDGTYHTTELGSIDESQRKEVRDSTRKLIEIKQVAKTNPASNNRHTLNVKDLFINPETKFERLSGIPLPAALVAHKRYVYVLYYDNKEKENRPAISQETGKFSKTIFIPVNVFKYDKIAADPSRRNKELSKVIELDPSSIKAEQAPYFESFKETTHIAPEKSKLPFKLPFKKKDTGSDHLSAFTRFETGSTGKSQFFAASFPDEENNVHQLRETYKKLSTSKTRNNTTHQSFVEKGAEKIEAAGRQLSSEFAQRFKRDDSAPLPDIF